MSSAEAKELLLDTWWQLLFFFFSKRHEWLRAAPFTQIGDTLMSAVILLLCFNHVFADYIHPYIQPCEPFLCKSRVQSSCYSSMAVFSFKPYRLDLYSQHASAHRSLLLSYIISQPARMKPHFGRQISCRNLTDRQMHSHPVSLRCHCSFSLDSSRSILVFSSGRW